MHTHTHFCTLLKANNLFVFLIEHLIRPCCLCLLNLDLNLFITDVDWRHCRTLWFKVVKNPQIFFFFFFLFTGCFRLALVNTSWICSCLAPFPQPLLKSCQLYRGIVTALHENLLWKCTQGKPDELHYIYLQTTSETFFYLIQHKELVREDRDTPQRFSVVLLLLVLFSDPSPSLNTNTEEMNQAWLSIVPEFVACTLKLTSPLLSTMPVCQRCCANLLSAGRKEVGWWCNTWGIMY